MDSRSQLSVGEPGIAGTHGVGSRSLSVRHPGNALVLDWRDPGDALPGAGDDAVLLHLQNAFGAGILEAALRRSGANAVIGFVRLHDGADERHQYVLDGTGDEGR